MQPTLANTGRVHSRLLFFRIGAYSIFLSLILLEKYLGVQIPESCYLIAMASAVGVDLQALAAKFFRIK